MIIAVDYDGTLENNGEINRDLIARLKQAQKNGNVVILWTCREGKRLTDALKELNRAGFRPNYINDNAPEVVRMIRRNPRKIYADIYIDDKAQKI